MKNQIINQEQRRAAAWELLAENHNPIVLDWLPLIARRDLLPGMGKIMFSLYNALLKRFPEATAGELLAAVHAEERLARKAEKRGEKPSSPPQGEIAAWLRGELGETEPRPAWGILCQLQMQCQMLEQPASASAVGELYRDLRKDRSPEEIIKLARDAERKARKLNKPSMGK